MKKLIIGFLTGILLISLTACGNRPASKATAANVTANAADKFKNSVFIGDSITEGFAVNEILPKDSVMAGAGAIASWIYDEYMEDLAAKKPDKIFIMLGSDDMLMPSKITDNPKGLFESNMTKLIVKIKKELPNSKIYIESITPVTQEALKEEPRYKQIDEYNELLKEISEKLSVNYVDIGTLAKENPNLFAEDGIHFKKEFYILWLNKLSALV